MTESFDFETLARKTLELMPRLHRLMTTQMKLLTENETTMMQIGTLRMLMHHDKMTTSDLAKHRHVSLQAASTFVQGLVERGWVIRVDDPNDRRRAILEVTAEGREQEHALHNELISQLSTILTDLSPEELSAAEIFFTGLDRIIQQYQVDESVPKS